MATKKSVKPASTSSLSIGHDLEGLLGTALAFEREDGSPFGDGYSIAKEEALLADFISDGAPEGDLRYDRYIELLDRKERLVRMKQQFDERKGADVIASRDEAVGIADLGALQDDGVDQMTLHTIEAYRLFLGRSRDPANPHLVPLIGGKRVASALRNLWLLTANDNPYAEWALVQHEHGVKQVQASLQADIEMAETQLNGLRKRGLNFSMLSSNQPAVTNLGFRSPYGYAISMLLVDFDYFVRVQKTLQRKNLRTDVDMRTAITNILRSIRSIFHSTERFSRWLNVPEIRMLSRRDWITSSDTDAAKRLEFALETFGPVPGVIFKLEVAPSHSRRRYSITEAERKMIQQIGNEIETAASKEDGGGGDGVGPSEAATEVS